MRKLLFLLLPLFAFYLHCFSQHPHILDSLQTALSNHNARKLELGKNVTPLYDTTAASLLVDMAWQYANSNPDTAMKLALEVQSMSENLGWKRGIGNAWQIRGFLHQYKGDYAASLDCHNKALALWKETGNRKGVAIATYHIGGVNDNLGNYAEAVKYYFEALRINEQTGNKRRQAENLIAIAGYYIRLRNFPEAHSYLSAALKLFQEVGDKDGIANCNRSLGIASYGAGNYKEALQYHTNALKLWEEAGNKIMQAYTFNEFGLIYMKEGNYPEALRYQTAALKIQEEMEDKFAIGYSCNNIGEIYRLEKKYAQSAGYYNKALALALSTGNLDAVSEVYRDIAKLDSARGNYKEALAHYKVHILNRDSVWNSENARKVAQQQMQFDFDKKQLADSLQFAQEKELGAVSLQKQKAITYGGFSATAITLILLFSVYRNYKKLKETQEQLIKSEKMAAFGVMASRMAHEIQNPLNFVNNFSETAGEMVNDLVTLNDEQSRAESAKDLIANLDKIKHHGKRAEAIVKQLQEHTNKGTAHEFFEAKQVTT